MPDRPRATRRQGAGSFLLSVFAVCGLIVGVMTLWSDVPVVGGVVAAISAAVLLTQYDYYWRNDGREFDN